jgi:hypothetical protein
MPRTRSGVKPPATAAPSAPLSPHGQKIRAGRTMSPTRREARSKAMAELSLRGWSYNDIGAQFNLSRDRVYQLLRQAEEAGLIDDVRSEMVATLLPLSQQTYEHVLTTPAAELTEHVKAHELKLKAARQVTDRFIGKAGEKKEDRFTAKLSMTYEEFMKVREARANPAVPGEDAQLVDGVLLHDGPARNDESEHGQLRWGIDCAPQGNTGVADGVSGDDADSARPEVDGAERRGDDQSRARGAGELPEQATAGRGADVPEDVAGAEVDAVSE